MAVLASTHFLHVNNTDIYAQYVQRKLDRLRGNNKCAAGCRLQSMLLSDRPVLSIILSSCFKQIGCLKVAGVKCSVVCTPSDHGVTTEI